MDSFKNISEVAVSDAIVLKTISSFRRLEELVVLSPIHQQRPSILADACLSISQALGAENG